MKSQIRPTHIEVDTLEEDAFDDIVVMLEARGDEYELLLSEESATKLTCHLAEKLQEFQKAREKSEANMAQERMMRHRAETRA